jgi:hypothetical protein
LFEGEAKVEEEEGIDGVVKPSGKEGAECGEAAEVSGRALTGFKGVHDAMILGLSAMACRCQMVNYYPSNAFGRAVSR